MGSLHSCSSLAISFSMAFTRYTWGLPGVLPWFSLGFPLFLELYFTILKYMNTSVGHVCPHYYGLLLSRSRSISLYPGALFAGGGQCSAHGTHVSVFFPLPVFNQVRELSQCLEPLGQVGSVFPHSQSSEAWLVPILNRHPYS